MLRADGYPHNNFPRTNFPPIALSPSPRHQKPDLPVRSESYSGTITFPQAVPVPQLLALNGNNATAVRIVRQVVHDVSHVWGGGVALAFLTCLLGCDQFINIPFPPKYDSESSDIQIVAAVRSGEVFKLKRAREGQPLIFEPNSELGFIRLPCTDEDLIGPDIGEVDTSRIPEPTDTAMHTEATGWELPLPPRVLLKLTARSRECRPATELYSSSLDSDTPLSNIAAINVRDNEVIYTASRTKGTEFRSTDTTVTSSVVMQTRAVSISRIPTSTRALFGFGKRDFSSRMSHFYLYEVATRDPQSTKQVQANLISRISIECDAAVCDGLIVEVPGQAMIVQLRKKLVYVPKDVRGVYTEELPKDQDYVNLPNRVRLDRNGKLYIIGCSSVRVCELATTGARCFSEDLPEELIGGCATMRSAMTDLGLVLLSAEAAAVRPPLGGWVPISCEACRRGGLRRFALGRVGGEALLYAEGETGAIETWRMFTSIDCDAGISGFDWDDVVSTMETDSMFFVALTGPGGTGAISGVGLRAAG